MFNVTYKKKAQYIISEIFNTQMFINLFDAFWYMDNVFDLKYLVFDTNIITSKSIKIKCKLSGLRETGPGLSRHAVVHCLDDFG